MFALHSAINNENELIDGHRSRFCGMEGYPPKGYIPEGMEFTAEAVKAMERELKDLRQSLPNN